MITELALNFNNDLDLLLASNLLDRLGYYSEIQGLALFFPVSDKADADCLESILTRELDAAKLNYKNFVLEKR